MEKKKIIGLSCGTKNGNYETFLRAAATGAEESHATVIKTTQQQEVIIGLLFFLIIFILPLTIFLVFDTPYEVVVPVLMISILVLMWFFHRENVKQSQVFVRMTGQTSLCLSGATIL